MLRVFSVWLGSQIKEGYMPLLQCEAASSNMMPVQRAWWQDKQEATFSKQTNGRAPRNSICSGSRHSGHTASHSYCPVTSVNPRSDRHRILRPCYLTVKHSYSPGFETKNQIQVQRSFSTLDNTNCKWKTAFRFSSLYTLNNEITYLRETQYTCIIVVVLCVLLSYVYLLYCVGIAFFFTLDAGLLARIQYSEGPVTGHLDTGLSWFPCVYKRMLRWFPTFQVATTCFSCSPPDLNLVVTNFMFCLHVK